MKQLYLFKEKQILEFGGNLNRGKRKTARPLDPKRSLHFVLKATNAFVLLGNRKKVDELVQSMNRRFGVRVYGIRIEADHIHLSTLIKNRELYRRWIRALTAVLVLRIASLKFSLRPYSRIVSWGRQFRELFIIFVKISTAGSSFCSAICEWRDGWPRSGIPRVPKPRFGTLGSAPNPGAAHRTKKCPPPAPFAPKYKQLPTILYVHDMGTTRTSHVSFIVPSLCTPEFEAPPEMVNEFDVVELGTVTEIGSTNPSPYVHVAVTVVDEAPMA